MENKVYEQEGFYGTSQTGIGVLVIIDSRFHHQGRVRSETSIQRALWGIISIPHVRARSSTQVIGTFLVYG